MSLHFIYARFKKNNGLTGFEYGQKWKKEAEPFLKCLLFSRTLTMNVN